MVFLKGEFRKFLVGLSEIIQREEGAILGGVKVRARPIGMPKQGMVRNNPSLLPPYPLRKEKGDFPPVGEEDEKGGDSVGLFCKETAEMFPIFSEEDPEQASRAQVVYRTAE